MQHQQVIDNIKQVAARVLPKGSTVYLYGSRARGDWNENSDWDLLILLGKPKRDSMDWENYAWPFTEMITREWRLQLRHRCRKRRR